MILLRNLKLKLWYLFNVWHRRAFPSSIVLLLFYLYFDVVVVVSLMLLQEQVQINKITICSIKKWLGSNRWWMKLSFSIACLSLSHFILVFTLAFIFLSMHSFLSFLSKLSFLSFISLIFFKVSFSILWRKKTEKIQLSTRSFKYSFPYNWLAAELYKNIFLTIKWIS